MVQARDHQDPLVAQDARLLAIDEALLGVTPALWLERWICPATTQWFAFFYWSYFVIIAVMWIPALFFDRGRR